MIEVLSDHQQFEILGCQIVPDDITEIQNAIYAASVTFSSKLNLILTSGGTGFTPRDQTPEAVEKMISKRCDSLNYYMQGEALKCTPMACLSRSVIGIMIEETQQKQILIVTLPGKPKAIKENWEILTRNRLINHALAQMQN